MLNKHPVFDPVSHQRAYWPPMAYNQGLRPIIAAGDTGTETMNAGVQHFFRFIKAVQRRIARALGSSRATGGEDHGQRKKRAPESRIRPGPD